MAERSRRDRDGEPFEDDFTDDRGVAPAAIEQAQHLLIFDGEEIQNVEQRKEINGTEKEQHAQEGEQAQEDERGQDERRQEEHR